MSLGDIVIYGAGSIGSTIGGWLTPEHHDVYLMARGEHAKIMNEHGLTLLETNRNPEIVNVKLINSLSEAPNARVVVVAVKNYDLEGAAQDIFSKLGNKPTIVALQNGVENQRVLPKYFSSVIYGVVGYSAMITEPGTVEYQSRGPVYLGTIDNKPEYSMKEICQTFNQDFQAEITSRLQDTVHCKIVLNLTNALFTLVGLNYSEISSYDKLATMASKLVNEGIDVIQAAGYREYPFKNYPSWRTLRLGLKLPSFMRTSVLKKNVEHALLNSMGQDVLIKRRKETELEFLNKYVLDLANSAGVQALCNRALYNQCKSSFNQQDFRPMTIEEVWDLLKIC
jgi:2-dehydropantoate 2-reductase